MPRLRRWLDRLGPLFAKGGRYEHFHVIYEMVDTLFYSPPDVTRTSPHVRDGIDLKRVMVYVVIAVTPAAIVGIWNIGYQANDAMSWQSIAAAPGWRGDALAFFGLGYAKENIFDCFTHGLLYFLPVYVVTLVVGGFWEVLFAAVRNHEVNEGFLATSILFALTLPPAIPLWQVALGISFGVVIAKEVFGGTGKNFLNPALAGRAFLFFAYPGDMAGDIWNVVDTVTSATTVEGYSGATPLLVATTGGLTGLQDAGVTLWNAFVGPIKGAMGSTSTLACLIGGAFLIYTRVASWRIMAGVCAGLVVTTLLLNAIGSDDNPLFELTWQWHFVLGGFAFGMVFMATDPVSAAQTDAGRWVFGGLVGAMTVLIRVLNPAYTEGIMLAILFGNLFAPIIDYVVVQVNVRRRARRFRGSTT
jgi:Na+-transporting NADH:ubiquinone oxidoreductase subunit B